MKISICKLAILVYIPFLSGCAETVFYTATGQKRAKFQGDMIGSEYHETYPGGSVSWTVQQVSHSTATLAGGAATSNIITSTLTGAGGVILSLGTAGFGAKAAAVAVPVVANAFQPRPAALQAH